MSEQEPRTEGPEPEAQPSDEELVAQLREEIKRLRVADVATEVMVSLVTLGYQKMGLTAETLDLRRLPDARLAIELLRSLIEALEREQAGDVAAFRSTLAAMQLQYARVASLPAGVLPGDEAGPASGTPARSAGAEQEEAAGAAGEPSTAGPSTTRATAPPADADASRQASKLWVPPGVRRDDEGS